MKPTALFVAALIAVASLAVGSSAPAAAARTIGQIIDDTTIVATVKAKLTADKLSNLTKIDVKSEQGAVTLGGTVDSPDRRARAAQIAGSVNGVKAVVNNIDVKGVPAAASSSPPGSASFEATGTVASVDATNGTITLQDGRVLKTTDQTLVWQPSSVGALKPGAQVFVRGAAPAGFQPGASASGGEWRMGTVSRVDSAGGQFVLNDGSIVRVTSTTNIHRRADRLTLDQIEPGAEIVVRPSSVTARVGSDVSALPQQTTLAPTLDASEVSVLWTPALGAR